MYKISLDWPFGSTWSMSPFVPEGYDLVEKTDHKQKRLEEEIKSLERQVEYHNASGAAATDKLKELKKDLEKLAIPEKV